jgi:hypothetical protein
MGRGAPDPEGWLMKPSIRVNITIKVEIAVTVSGLAALLLLLSW